MSDFDLNGAGAIAALSILKRAASVISPAHAAAVENYFIDNIGTCECRDCTDKVIILMTEVLGEIARPVAIASEMGEVVGTEMVAMITFSSPDDDQIVHRSEVLFPSVTFTGERFVVGD